MPIVICDPQKKASHKNTILAEIRAMERVLYDTVVNAETAPAHRALCARAYEALENRRNIIRMKPAPKPIDVRKPPRAKPGGASPLESA